MKKQQLLEVIELIPEAIQTAKTEQDSSYQNFTYCLLQTGIIMYTIHYTHQ